MYATITLVSPSPCDPSCHAADVSVLDLGMLDRTACACMLQWRFAMSRSAKTPQHAWGSSSWPGNLRQRCPAALFCSESFVTRPSAFQTSESPISRFACMVLHSGKCLHQSCHDCHAERPVSSLETNAGDRGVSNRSVRGAGSSVNKLPISNL